MTLFGIVFGLFATQNVNPVLINLGTYSLTDIPLYILVLGSMLVGILMSAVISGINSMSAFMSIKGRDNKIKATEHDLEKMTERLHVLEVENAKLKGKPVVESSDGTVVIEHPKPSIMSRIRQAFP